MRVLGCTNRDAGSLNPSGSSGLGTSLLVWRTASGDISSGLLVPVIALTVVGATAFCGLGLALVVVASGHLDASPFHPDHGSDSIN
jgi:hypothetical protein